MVLQYKNFSTDLLLKQSRNIQYANGQITFGQNNVIEVTNTIEIEVRQWTEQADVFARQMMTYSSNFDMKRFLGSIRQDWTRLLHETYIYAKAKALYLGIYSNRIAEYPQGYYNFPGNVLVANLLKSRDFQFRTDDMIPYTVSFKVDFPSDNAADYFEELFAVYPDVAEGMSTIPGTYAYTNQTYEIVLNGLYNAQSYLNSMKSKPGAKSQPQLFQITTYDDAGILKFLNEESFPFMNSFLAPDCKKYYFTLPTSLSGPGVLRNNESVYLPRALGFKGVQVNFLENNLYKVATRNTVADIFCRDEMYSITGLKTEFTPNTDEEIKKYLGMNSYKSSSFGGNEPTP